MDEEALKRKLQAIEALFAGAATEGERAAAGAARERILERLKAASEAAPPIEYRFSMSNEWSHRLFVALLRRYGLHPFRYKGQRYTTVMVRVQKSFVDQTLWPQFVELDKTLMRYLDDVAERVIREVLQQESGDVEEKPQPPALGPGSKGGSSGTP